MSFNTFVRLAVKSDSTFLLECFNNSAEQNQFDSHFIDYSSDKPIFDIIRGIVNEKDVNNNLYIVNKNGKDISFFTPKHNTVSCNVGGLIFIHPRACKMSIITSAKCLVLQNIIRSLSTVDCKNMLIPTWHKYIIQSFMQVIPDAKYIELFTSQFLFIANIESNSSSYVEALDLYKVQNTDGELAFECSM